jgi:hypothetical protein
MKKHTEKKEKHLSQMPKDLVPPRRENREPWNNGPIGINGHLKYFVK